MVEILNDKLEIILDRNEIKYPTHPNPNDLDPNSEEYERQLYEGYVELEKINRDTIIADKKISFYLTNQIFKDLKNKYGVGDKVFISVDSRGSSFLRYSFFEVMPEHIPNKEFVEKLNEFTINAETYGEKLRELKKFVNGYEASYNTLHPNLTKIELVGELEKKISEIPLVTELPHSDPEETNRYISVRKLVSSKSGKIYATDEASGIESLEEIEKIKKEIGTHYLVTNPLPILLKTPPQIELVQNDLNQRGVSFKTNSWFSNILG